MDIQNINRDGVRMYYYFEGVFEQLSETKTDATPTETLQWLASNNAISQSIQAIYMLATDFKIHC